MGRDREEAVLGRVRHEYTYMTIKELNGSEAASVTELCAVAGIPRPSYYKWCHRLIPDDERLNEKLVPIVKAIHESCPDKGCRRIRDDIFRDCGIAVSDNRILRICRFLNIKSTIKYRNEGCTISDRNPRHIAANILDRDFKSEKPNEKWLTDVTEFKYYIGLEKKKMYLSAILDLYDRRIVSYVIGDSNNNQLVFDTFDRAVELEPDAHPIFHSDRRVPVHGQSIS